MNAPPHATKFWDLPCQMMMADPPLHGEEVSRERFLTFYWVAGVAQTVSTGGSGCLDKGGVAAK